MGKATPPSRQLISARSQLRRMEHVLSGGTFDLREHGAVGLDPSRREYAEAEAKRLRKVVAFQEKLAAKKAKATVK